jgi:hypothetical protein
VKLNGPACPTKKSVILDATSKVCMIWTGILLR